MDSDNEDELSFANAIYIILATKLKRKGKKHEDNGLQLYSKIENLYVHVDTTTKRNAIPHDDNVGIDSIYCNLHLLFNFIYKFTKIYTVHENVRNTK